MNAAERKEKRGRKRTPELAQQMGIVLKEAGFQWPDIAQALGIGARTLSRFSSLHKMDADGSLKPFISNVRNFVNVISAAKVVEVLESITIAKIKRLPADRAGQLARTLSQLGLEIEGKIGGTTNYLALLMQCRKDPETGKIQVDEAQGVIIDAKAKDEPAPPV